ncbi:MAG: N-acetylmuramoyl-L-alanine amidase [Verrucomicrobiota bacterium]
MHLVWAALLFFTGATFAQAEPPAPFTVAIDVGHSIKKPGAISARGRGEFYFNRDIARQLKAALEARGFRAFLINESGADISLLSRGQTARSKGADLFISVHHDAVNQKYYRQWEYDGQTRPYSDAFRGYSVFVSKKNPQAAESRRLGGLLAASMQAAGFTPTLHHNEPIPGENRPLINRDTGLYEFSDLVVLKTSRMPAVLLECGVIVHREEELEMLKPEVQRRIVAATVRAVEQYVAGEKAAGVE